MRLRSVLTCFMLTIATLAVQGQSKKTAPYKYTIALTRVTNERMYVELTPPSITKPEITFYLPKIVPGTYAIADYGRYVTDITAVNKNGNKLPVEKIDENSWKIKNAT